MQVIPVENWMEIRGSSATSCAATNGALEVAYDADVNKIGVKKVYAFDADLRLQVFPS